MIELQIQPIVGAVSLMEGVMCQQILQGQSGETWVTTFLGRRAQWLESMAA
jgi:hypothetical protein